jgi:hypothetical protein
MASQDRAWTPQEALYPADELEEVLGHKRCAELKQECTEDILLLHLFNEFEWETSPQKKRIDIVDLSSTDVEHLTRFTISEIKRIRRLLGIPDRFSTPARVPFHGDEALFLQSLRNISRWHSFHGSAPKGPKGIQQNCQRQQRKFDSAGSLYYAITVRHL